MKLCTKCNTSKDYSCYHRDKYSKDGYYPSCIECNRHKRSDPVAKAKYDKEYRKSLGWRKKANQFKTTVSYLDELFIKQNGLCAICRRPETIMHHSGAKMSLAIDHDHSNGKVRGFLCQKCNQGIGMFQDNTDLLKSAIKYLQETAKL